MSVQKTTLHPEGDQSVDLYPKTNTEQVEGLSSETVPMKNNPSLSVQDSFERIDGEIEYLTDEINSKLDSNKNAISQVGGLVVPSNRVDNIGIVGVTNDGEQVQVKIGNGLSITGTTSPYELESSGGSGGTQLYKHILTFRRLDGQSQKFKAELIDDKSTAYANKQELYEKHPYFTCVAVAPNSGPPGDIAFVAFTLIQEMFGPRLYSFIILYGETLEVIANELDLDNDVVTIL